VAVERGVGQDSPSQSDVAAFAAVVVVGSRLTWRYLHIKLVICKYFDCLWLCACAYKESLSLVGIRPFFVRVATIERTVGIPRIASDSQPDTAAKTGADTELHWGKNGMGYENKILQIPIENPNPSDCKMFVSIIYTVFFIIFYHT